MLTTKELFNHICRLNVRDYDGKVTPEEVASAAMYLKENLDKEGIQELISSLSKDRGECIPFLLRLPCLSLDVINQLSINFSYTSLQLKSMADLFEIPALVNYIFLYQYKVRTSDVGYNKK